jgi:hypothetical protein
MKVKIKFAENTSKVTKNINECDFSTKQILSPAAELRSHVKSILSPATKSPLTINLSANKEKINKIAFAKKKN